MRTIFAKGNKKTTSKLIGLRKTAQADKAPRVALRIQGILMSLDGYTTGDIARILHVDRTTVYSWVKNWNRFKEDGLLEGYRSGRPSMLTEKDKISLYDIIESGPVSYGCNAGVWTSPMITGIIKDEFQISYHPGHVRKLLKHLGFSVQRPTTQLVQANRQLQNKWIRYTYPNLKKKPGASQR